MKISRSMQTPGWTRLTCMYIPYWTVPPRRTQIRYRSDQGILNGSCDEEAVFYMDSEDLIAPRRNFHCYHGEDVSCWNSRNRKSSRFHYMISVGRSQHRLQKGEGTCFRAILSASRICMASAEDKVGGSDREL